MAATLRRSCPGGGGLRHRQERPRSPVSGDQWKDRALSRPRISLPDLVAEHRRHRAGEDPAADGSHLRTIHDFGPNPGALTMRAFVPPGLPPGAPLLVVLHGCGQSAAGFDRGCGWSGLAARFGFALLLPEQRRANNARCCFNWFEPAHTARGAGEAASIRAMVGHMLMAHRLDPARVFVAGLSAGGAMASVMLATYPEVFAAGAIIAGLPYGAAAGMRQALEAMASGRPRPAAAWAALVRAASPHRGPSWPRVSIWQGEADTTVRPVNAGEIVKQWTTLHGLAGAPWQEAGPAGARRRVWRGPDGTPLVEHVSLPDLGHGVPIRPGRGEGCCGQPMPFILDAGISAPHAIAAFFGLATAKAAAIGPEGRGAGATRMAEDVVSLGAAGHTAAAAMAGPDRQAGPGPGEVERPQAARSPASPGQAAPGKAVRGSIIRRALAAAGLLRR